MFEITQGVPIILMSNVKNCSTFPVMIRAGERLGFAESVEELIVQTACVEAEPEEASSAPVTHNLTHLSPTEMVSVQRVLSAHEGVFYRKNASLEATHLTQHKIELKAGAGPAYTAQYALPHTQLEATKKLVIEMLRQEIIEPARSPFNSPIILVREANGE